MIPSTLNLDLRILICRLGDETESISPLYYYFLKPIGVNEKTDTLITIDPENGRFNSIQLFFENESFFDTDNELYGWRAILFSELKDVNLFFSIMISKSMSTFLPLARLYAFFFLTSRASYLLALPSFIELF